MRSLRPGPPWSWLPPSRFLDFVHHADDHRANRTASAREHLRRAVALVEHEHAVPLPRVDDVEGQAGPPLELAARALVVDEEQALPVQGRVLDRGQDVADDARELHEPPPAISPSSRSTRATMAASAGLKAS